MPTKINRARRSPSPALVEQLEPRQLLSALGFAASIRPARFHPVPSPSITLATIQPPPPGLIPAGTTNPGDPIPFNIDAYQNLRRASTGLNNPGSVALTAIDQVPFAGEIGAVHLPVAYQTAFTPQTSIQRPIAGESLFLALDWGDGTPQSLGTFQSISPATYAFAGTHTYNRPGDYRLTAFLIVNGAQSDLPWVLAQAVGIAHVEATEASTLTPATIHLPLYDPRFYVPPVFPQIKLPTSTPVDDAGNSKVYNFVVG